MVPTLVLTPDMGKEGRRSVQILPGRLLRRKWRAVVDEDAGAPEEIRTPDPQIRSLVLYPAELRARVAAAGREAERAGTAVEL